MEVALLGATNRAYEASYQRWSRVHTTNRQSLIVAVRQTAFDDFSLIVLPRRKNIEQRDIHKMKLLEPVRLGSHTLKNRMVMAAMTRSRADDYDQAARNAIEAGFDGVELHAANGYLPNQFLAESANQRTDEYGGSKENNCKFTLEVMEELVHAVGGDNVGIKISPLHPYASIQLDNPVATFTFLIQELNKMDIVFVELMKRSPMFPLLPSSPKDDEIELFGKLIKHTLIANTAYNKETGEAELEKGIAKLISFGSLFLANPDLPNRFQLNAEINQPDRATMFGGGEKGYTDYRPLD